MTESSKHRENALASTVSSLKPDFREIEEESIQSLLAAQPGNDDVAITQLSGGPETSGTSSGIVIFDANINGEPKEYILRYAPYNNDARIFAEYDISSQFKLHQILHGQGLPVPLSFCSDVDQKHLPQPGFVMERIMGESPATMAYAAGPLAEASQEQRKSMEDQILVNLGKLHSLDWRGLGLHENCINLDGANFLEGFLDWYMANSEWAQIEQLPLLKSFKKWLFDNQPSYNEEDWSFIHGDSNLGNYMFHDGKLAAIIDWELAAILNGSFDLALQISQFEMLRPAHPAELQANIPTEQEWISRYEALTGRKIVDFEFWKKVNAFANISILSSMSRGMPEEYKATYTAMMAPFLAIAENPGR